MGPSFAESASRSRFVWLIGTLCASVIALAALRPSAAPPRRAPASFKQFDHYKPVKKCVDGRWVIAHRPRQ
jgi:hypothetical protein